MLVYSMIGGDKQGGDIVIFMRNYFKLDILIKCSSIDTHNEAIKTLLKDSQTLACISAIYISLASLINTNYRHKYYWKS